MSKIAISSEGPGMDSMVDPRFGRASGFVIYDTESRASSYLPNGESQTRSQGAGIATAQMLANEGVEIVLTGQIGPKAFQALQAAGIKMCDGMHGLDVNGALQRFESGSASFASSPSK